MTSMHDDRPHPIPPAAYLRYKENYFFIIMDPERGVFGVAHFNNEPIFNRSRFTLNLNVQGRQFAYNSETPLPEKFAMAESLSDGKLSLRFVEPHKRFDLKLTGADFSADVVFEAHRPTFDYGACRTAAPDMPSFQEIMTMGLNLPFNHQQQSLTVRGRIAGGGTTIELNGWGYRDHSWVFRGDSVVARHFWTGLNFPDRAFGMKTLETLHRPGIWAKEGYVSDALGERALKAIRVTSQGEKDGWPEKLRFEFKDVLDKSFTIEVDVAGRYSEVALHAEKAVGQRASYEIIESCCPLTLIETGDRGVGLIEIGKHPSIERPWAA